MITGNKKFGGAAMGSPSELFRKKSPYCGRANIASFTG